MWRRETKRCEYQGQKYIQHTELDDLLLNTQERQQQAEVETAAASEANSKKLDKERQGAEETRPLSMECLSETQKRRGNGDDDFDITSPKQRKSRSSATDTIANVRERKEKDFKSRHEELKLKREYLGYGKASQTHMENA